MADLRQKWPKLSLFEFCYIRNAFVYFYQDKEVPLFWLNCAKTISQIHFSVRSYGISRTGQYCHVQYVFFFQSMLYTSYNVFQEQLIH